MTRSGDVGPTSSQIALGETLVEEEKALVLPLSKALLKKIEQKATDEGVTVTELACELIAEGLVLRAWEIMERKSAMRGTSSSNSYSKNNRYREQKGRRNFNRSNRNEKNNNILEDRAAFLEYVRNQEKNRK